MAIAGSCQGGAGGRKSSHFRDNRARKEKPLRLSPDERSVFSELERYPLVESSADDLGNHFLASLSFFGVPMKDEKILQPVACDMECECIGGSCGMPGVGGSMGSREGDGAVDGRLRIGRRGFGEVLGLSVLPGVWLTPRGGDTSFFKANLIGAEGELRALPAERGRSGVISCIFLFSCIVDGRFLLATAPKTGGCESLRPAAVDGRTSCFGPFLLLCVITLVAVDGR